MILKLCKYKKARQQPSSMSKRFLLKSVSFKSHSAPQVKAAHLLAVNARALESTQPTHTSAPPCSTCFPSHVAPTSFDFHMGLLRAIRKLNEGSGLEAEENVGPVNPLEPAVKRSTLLHPAAFYLF